MKEEGQGFLVKDLLHIPQFKDALLLGGAVSAKLEQPVTRVNVMEVPDVVDWVRPGEFLITTGYPFHQDPEVLADLIKALAEKNIAALGIKTKRFIGTVPQSAIEAANIYGLPLIELPPSTTFSDVVREVMERVLVQESQQLSVLQNRVQRLSHVLLHGDGLSAFLQLLATLVENPVVLLGGQQEWAASPGAQTLCEQISGQDWERLLHDSASVTHLVSVGERQMRVHCSTVFEEAPDAYLLLMLEDRKESGIIDTLTLNWASKLVGFEITNAQARRKIEAKYIDQFLQDWISGRIVSPVDLQMRAEACGSPLREDATYIVGMVRFPTHNPKFAELQELAKRLQWQRLEEGSQARWIVMDEQLVVLLSIYKSERMDPQSIRGECSAVVSALRSTCTERDIQLCFGRPVFMHTQVPGSYKEAARGVEVSALCHLHKDTIFYNDLGTYILLYRMLETEEAEEFKRNYLEPLMAYDRKNHNQGVLLKTLKTFLACNGNMKETAERMFVHYNTITYRLERLRSELGIALDDAETRLQLQLAIKLHEMKET